jgi:hypothetical protein
MICQAVILNTADVCSAGSAVAADSQLTWPDTGKGCGSDGEMGGLAGQGGLIVCVLSTSGIQFWSVMACILRYTAAFVTTGSEEPNEEQRLATGGNGEAARQPYVQCMS